MNKLNDQFESTRVWDGMDEISDTSPMKTYTVIFSGHNRVLHVFVSSISRKGAENAAQSAFETALRKEGVMENPCVNRLFTFRGRVVPLEDGEE